MPSHQRKPRSYELHPRDPATAVPLSAYRTMQMRNLDGSGYLSGKWVNVRTNTGPAAYSTSNTFIYGRADDRFEQVMGYFWVNQAQEYLQSLGFGSTLRPVNMHSQDLRIDQYGIDNSDQTGKQDSWDTTLVDSQFDYAPDTSFSAAARAIYARALTRDGRAAADLVRDGFAARHITF